MEKWWDSSIGTCGEEWDSSIGTCGEVVGQQYRYMWRSGGTAV